MAQASPSEGGSPIFPPRRSEAHALRTDALLDPGRELLVVMRDPTRPAHDREEAFRKFLVTASPTWGRMKPIEWAKSKARAYVALLNRHYPLARSLEPDGLATMALMALQGDGAIDKPAGYVFQAIKNHAKWHMAELAKEQVRRGEFPEQVPAPTPEPTDDEAAILARWEHVGHCLNTLPPKLRAVAIMRLENTPLNEIAMRLKLKPATVRKRWERAILALTGQPAALPPHE